MKLLDSGHRERQFGLALWKRLSLKMPFWKFLEDVTYDPYTDMLVLPDGTQYPVEGT